jgi:GNAT superfamily N-acetyltransferase
MEVRRVTRDELRAAHEARLATWKVAYRGLVPDAHLDALILRPEDLARFEQRFDAGEGRTYGAWLDGALVGMAVSGACRDEDRYGEQELYALYVLPSHWGTGVAQALWEAALPFTSLWVLQDNARARAFYARNGFRPDVTKAVEIGVELTEVRYLLA